jgi:hypothetical protein
MAYKIREKDDPPLEFRTIEEYLARLEELEPFERKVKEAMKRQLTISPDIWDFRFTV